MSFYSLPDGYMGRIRLGLPIGYGSKIVNVVDWPQGGRYHPNHEELRPNNISSFHHHHLGLWGERNALSSLSQAEAGSLQLLTCLPTLLHKNALLLPPSFRGEEALSMPRRSRMRCDSGFTGHRACPGGVVKGLGLRVQGLHRLHCKLEGGTAGGLPPHYLQVACPVVCWWSMHVQ